MARRIPTINPESTPSSGDATDVLLVTMPFGPVESPSIGLSLLRAAVVPLDVRTEILYFNLRFAKQIGVQTYLDAALGCALSGLGEWIFSSALFEQSQDDVQRYLSEIVQSSADGSVPAREPLTARRVGNMLKARDQVGGFLDGCLREVLARRPRLVGFSSIFRQHVASLALASRVKQTSPETFIVFGGANCEGIMGVENVRQFPFIDAVVSGEGDIVFPKLVKRVLAGKPARGLPGVYTRGELPSLSPADCQQNAPAVTDLDALPYPDYDDFLAELEACKLDRPTDPQLLLETARGCWWGERGKCTFCGLNGVGLDYRSKSARRALAELEHLADRYPGCPIRAVDNVFNVAYFDDFIPALIERGLDLAIFYEVRADLTKQQLRMLRDAGITAIQPGIESLSTPVLKLMHKGVTALRNIELLKWCKELGIVPGWNILWGFPGEPAQEYARMATLVPLLRHLPSPYAARPIKLVRFSPLFEEADDFGLVEVEPVPAYEHIYPFGSEVISNLAYLFTYSYRTDQNVSEYARPLLDQARAWIESDGEYELFSVDDGRRLCIWDERPSTPDVLTVLRGRQRMLYLACDSAQSERQLQRLVERRSGRVCRRASIRELMSPLVEGGLVLKEGSRYLSLAVPVGDYSPASDAYQRFWSHLQRKEGACAMARIKIVDLPKGIRITEDELRKVFGGARGLGWRDWPDIPRRRGGSAIPIGWRDWPDTPRRRGGAGW